MPLTVLQADASIFAESAKASQQLHLLTNDALIVTMMRRRNLIHLATNDGDFDKVTAIRVWKPISD